MADISDDIAAAQIQASATIVAATIQADAAHNAAIIQAEVSACGAIIVLVAGILAYVAARKQASTSERAAKLRNLAFRHLLEQESILIGQEVEALAGQLSVYSLLPNSCEEIEFRNIMPTFLSETLWENHAMLGSGVLASVNLLRSSVSALNALLAGEAGKGGPWRKSEAIEAVRLLRSSEGIVVGHAEVTIGELLSEACSKVLSAGVQLRASLQVKGVPPTTIVTLQSVKARYAGGS